jgi:hypothetical protein
MKRMGFKYVKTQNLKRKILIERPDIVIKRRNYLREKQRLKKEFPNSNWYYLDETFVHEKIVKPDILVDNSN